MVKLQLRVTSLFLSKTEVRLRPRMRVPDQLMTTPKASGGGLPEWLKVETLGKERP